MSKVHVKTGDTVMLMVGDKKGDRGKKGKVLEVSPKEGKVIVEGINLVTKHIKPRQQGELGGRVQAESPIYACKVMPVCPKCDKPTRVGHKIEDGKKIRVCKHCGAELKY
ncbi:MAG: 50S ribosomal protein L24 [Oscillospiraceae bacterium]|nr:50S ribosomal protein L24 [Oscillospiraceae bacterium]